MKKILFILLFFVLSCKEPTPTDIRRDQHLPVITVIINGQKVNMILDTGGAVTILDDDKAKELGINLLDTEMVITGYGGNKEIILAEKTGIEIGNRLVYADIHVTDLGYLVNNKVHGIIGIPHIDDMVIDLKENTITFK